MPQINTACAKAFERLLREQSSVTQAHEMGWIEFRISYGQSEVWRSRCHCVLGKRERTNECGA
jgi:hypothetical protein